MVVFGHFDNLGMATGDDKGEERELRSDDFRICVINVTYYCTGEPVGIDVGF